MTLAALLALFGFPLQRIVTELDAKAAQYPDLASTIAEVKAMLESKASFDNLTAALGAAKAELKDLINRGEGPVTHDPVDLS